jgi:uncharacterized protein with von Willebrand factor type A (vWA) domain
MLIAFFLRLKEGGVPVSIREFLTLIEGLPKISTISHAPAW